MLAAFKHLHRFQRRADFLTWATRIVTNAALQHIRKARTKRTVAWDPVDEEYDPSFSKPLGDPQPNPEQQLQSREHREMLENALNKLPIECFRAIQRCRSSKASLCAA